MTAWRRILRWTLLGLTVLAVVGWGERDVVLAAVGSALVIDNVPPADADVAVISVSAPRAGAFVAARLYKEGHVSRLALFEGENLPIDEAIRGLGIVQLGPSDLAVAIAEKLGVPHDAIERLPGKIDGTGSEVAALVDIAQAHPGQRFVLITTPIHSARAQWLLQRSGAPISVALTPIDDFDPSAWWRSREGTRQVFFEYLRWGNTLLGDGWAKLAGGESS